MQLSFSYLVSAFAGTLFFVFLPATLYPDSYDFDAIRRKLSNQEASLRTIEQRLESYDTGLEILKEQIETSVSSQDKQIKGQSQNLEMKVAALENAAKNLAIDMKLLQSHANETASALKSVKQKLNDWEERLVLQNQNIDNLQTALQTVLEAFQIKAEAVSQKTHKVKNGESLGTIAKKYGTTIQAIKEANGMSSDKIVVDKTLKIPG